MLKRRSGSAFDLEGDQRMSVTGGEAEIGLRVRQVSFGPRPEVAPPVSAASGVWRQADVLRALMRGEC
jgi:hypothetical protein